MLAIRDAGFEFMNYDVIEPIEVPGEIDRIYHMASPASPIGYVKHMVATLKVMDDEDAENIARGIVDLCDALDRLLRERWLVNGEVCDTALYGLLLRDWQARTAPRR